MNDLLTMINHLLAATLAGQPGGGAVQLRSVVLDAQGGRVVLWLEHPLGRGEAVLSFQAEPEKNQTQTLTVTVERTPPELAPVLESFRRVLEKSRLRIELNFSD